MLLPAHCLVCMTEGRAVQRVSQGDNVTSPPQAHDAGVDPRATTDDDMLAKEAHRKNLPIPCRALTFIVDLLQRLRILAGVGGAARASMMLEASPGDISRGPAWSPSWSGSFGASFGALTGASHDHMLRMMFWISSGTGAAAAQSFSSL